MLHAVILLLSVTWLNQWLIWASPPGRLKDLKKVDGIIVFPFKDGAIILFGMLPAVIPSPSMKIKSMIDPGIISRLAKDCKLARYWSLSDRFLFLPIAVRIFSALGLWTTFLTHHIGSKTVDFWNKPFEGLNECFKQFFLPFFEQNIFNSFS